MATIIGTNGNDSGAGALVGTAFDDTIYGLDGNDEIYGLGGGDYIETGAGDDYVEAGAGNDTIVNTGGSDEIYAGDGNDLIDVSAADGSDWVVPGTGNDTVIGNEDTGISYYGLGFGLVADMAAGTVTGAGKSDIISGVNRVRGTDYDDVIIGGNAAHDDWEGFDGMAGNDFMDGGSGYDEILFHLEKGTSGITIDFAAGTATDTYGDQDTFMNMEAVRGSQWDDTMLGADGFQNFRGLAGDDFIDGRAGSDRADYSQDDFYGGKSGIYADLAAGYAIDGFGDTDTLVNIERVRGTNHDDVIIGDSAVNVLQGQGGSDQIDGGGGDDHIVGGRGDDVMTGGTGSDTFYFFDGDGSDVITDFGYFMGGAPAGFASHLPAKALAHAPTGDMIDLSGHSAVANFDDVLANAAQVGSDVVITLGDDQLTLQDFALADLAASQFLF